MGLRRIRDCIDLRLILIKWDYVHEGSLTTKVGIMVIFSCPIIGVIDGLHEG